MSREPGLPAEAWVKEEAGSGEPGALKKFYLGRMKQLFRFVLATGLVLCTNFVYARDYTICRQPVPAMDTIPAPDTTDGNTFERVEIEASFPGGDNAWRKYLEKNLDGTVPTRRKAPAGTYTVVIQFVVDKTGAVTQIKALTDHGYGMEEEVINLLKKAPRWEPAVQSGRVVKAYRKQPVTFMVEERRRKKNNWKSEVENTKWKIENAAFPIEAVSGLNHD